MKNISKFSVIIAVVSFLLTIVSSATAKYSGGMGEPNDPYQIATAEDLIALGEEPNDYDKNFILISDIDLSGYVFDKAVIAPGVNVFDEWEGYFVFEGTPFSGIFDGNDHTISHLKIEGGEYLGLFGRSGSGASISNLGLEAVDVNGIGDNVGGIVGWNDCMISSCYSSGSVNVNGEGTVGGLVGFNDKGTITLSYSTSDVNGFNGVGGLVGYNYRGTITSCYSTGSVTGDWNTGGLVGFNYESTVISCYSTGAVTGDRACIGGFIGHNYFGTITSCYSIGAVDGGLGFVGCNDRGEAEGVFEYGKIISCFWDTQTSGTLEGVGGPDPDTSGITGKTTAEMQMFDTFLLAGWYPCGQSAIWTIDEGNDYPRLWWENRAGEPLKPINLSEFITGTGEPNDPYLIYTSQELNLIGRGTCDWNKNFKLMADIDLSGLSDVQFNIIGTDDVPFTGVFDGNSHTISNLTINGGSYVGLFGYLGSGAKIRALGVVDVNIVGSGSYVGGLVGYNDGGFVAQCYSTSSINGTDVIGGLVGENWGDVHQCYSSSLVDGNDVIGGLVGINNEDWWLGIHGIVTQCFWNIQTSGILDGVGNIDPDPNGVIGKTSAEMKTKSTFTDAGWDFVGEIINGPNDIWNICEGTNYPRFVWQISAGDFLCPDGIMTEDFDYFMVHYGDTNCDSSNGYCDGTDLDFSGTVDIYDFMILLDNWLKENP